jgi:hypothetical protein
MRYDSDWHFYKTYGDAKAEFNLQVRSMNTDGKAQIFDGKIFVQIASK